MSFWTYDGGAIDGDQIDWTGLSEITIPTTATITTNWTKALDFSGGSEHAKQVTSSNAACPLRMGGVSSTVAGNTTAGKTSNSTSARPWATAIVFNIDGNSSNQHIWNQGEGAGSVDDNIYLRVDSSRRLYLGFGRTGAVNELYLQTISTNTWYGVYIAHTGERLSGSDATAANLADCFDVRLLTNSSSWAAGNNLSTSTNWSNSASTTGGRMDRQFQGDFTVGGRGGNRNFHGKVASMIVTTLRRNVDMPSNTEIEKMVTDPSDWLTNTKVLGIYRAPDSSNDAIPVFQLNNNASAESTQIWLMGDGTSDSFSNMIRNQVYDGDQNISKLNLISMVSSDIQTVSINGLS